MVMPVVGFPAGQSAEKNGIVVTLTYFNRYLEKQQPDGKMTFMIVNLGDGSQTVSVRLALTYGTDCFLDTFNFMETMLPKSVLWRSFESDKIKTATFAKFIILSEGGDSGEEIRFELASFQTGDAPALLKET
jgi:hypothetical protein